VVVEVHPAGQQTTDAEHCDSERVDSSFEDAAVADNDDAIVGGVDRRAWAGLTIDFAVDRGAKLEALLHLVIRAVGGCSRVVGIRQIAPVVTGQIIKAEGNADDRTAGQELYVAK